MTSTIDIGIFLEGLKIKCYISNNKLHINNINFVVCLGGKKILSNTLFQMKKYKCKGKEYSHVYVYRNPSRHLGILAPNWSLHTEGAIKYLKGLEGKIDIDFDKVNKYLVEIDEANRSVELQFMNVYRTFKGAPCVLLHWLKGQVEKIIDREYKLRRIQQDYRHIESLVNNGADPKLIEKYILQSYLELKMPSFLSDDDKKDIMKGIGFVKDWNS